MRERTKNIFIAFPSFNNFFVCGSSSFFLLCNFLFTLNYEWVTLTCLSLSLVIHVHICERRNAASISTHKYTNSSKKASNYDEYNLKNNMKWKLCFDHKERDRCLSTTGSDVALCWWWWRSLSLMNFIETWNVKLSIIKFIHLLFNSSQSFFLYLE